MGLVSRAAQLKIFTIMRAVMANMANMGRLGACEKDGEDDKDDSGEDTSRINGNTKQINCSNWAV